MAKVSFQFRVEGVLTDVDTIALADPAATYGVKRNDTNAVVVASGTAMTHDGTGLYSYTFSEPAAGLTYTAYIQYTRRGATNYIPDTIVGSTTTPAAWYYSNQTSLTDFLGSRNLAIQSNLENDTDDSSVNSSRVQRDGDKSSAWFNAMMRGGYYAVPITVAGIAVNAMAADHETRVLFEMLSDMDVAARLNDHRAIYSNVGAEQKELDRMAMADRKYVRDELNAIKSGQRQIIADLASGVAKLPDLTTQAGQFETVKLRFDDECI